MGLDERLAAAGSALAEGVAPESDLRALRRRQQVKQRRRRVAASAVVVAGSVLGALSVVRAGEEEVGVSAGSSGQVEYERIEYSQQGFVTCPDGHPERESEVDSMVIEAWGDRSGRRWRNSIRYPNGSVRELVANGSPWYPSELHVAGALPDAALGCDGGVVDVLVMPVAGSSFFSLNPMDDVPVFPANEGDPNAAMPDELREKLPPQTRRLAVLSYIENSTREPGVHFDSRGRPAALWRSVVQGEVVDDGVSAPVSQVTDTYVDERTGEILERTYRNEVGSSAFATQRITLVERTTLSAGEDVFEVDGLELEPGVDTTVLPRCAGTIHGFELPPRAGESGDALPQSGTATLEAAKAAQHDARKRYGGTTVGIVEDRWGRAWRRSTDGSVEIIPEEIYSVVVTLDDQEDCPDGPAFVGVPVMFEYRPG